MKTALPYSRTERWLHQWAFAGVELQKSLADIEDRTYAASFKDIPLQAPVFITGMPRSGTTVLLDVLASVPGFASNTYRDMPFLLCPLLWDQISRRFRKEAKSRERMHADGMEVSEDSPEAFEEALWQAFWPKKYKGQIVPWRSNDRSAEFETFFRNHMRKTIALRTALVPGQAISHCRYISKNNANIARLPLLTALFPDCRIVVPFRNPVDHCASLLTQHRRFLEIQQDNFARAYMKYLGHYEFGSLLRPIAFPDTPQDFSQANGPDFWLAYWAAAYRFVLSSVRERVILLDYDALCADPVPHLQRLLCALDLDPAQSAALSRRFRAPTQHAAAQGSDTLLQAASAVHHGLREAAAKPGSF